MTKNPPDHDGSVNRFVEAIVYGEIADDLFRHECSRLMIPEAEALKAPLFSIGTADGTIRSQPN